MTKIAVFLPQGFADWEYALIAGTGGAYFGLETAFFTPVPGMVQSQGGLEAQVDRPLSELVNWGADGVAVIGSMIWSTEQAPAIEADLVQIHGAGAVVAGICGGTLPLARAGLLDGCAHTSNERSFVVENAPAYTGLALYHAGPAAVSDGRVITAPGTAPVSFTCALFQAVGVTPENVQQLRVMMAAEHAPA